MIRVIVTSDDCGLSEGINLATLDLHTRGIVSSASVLTNFPALQHALELFRRYPSLSVGVHLNLSDGLPVTRVPSPSALTRADGRFRPVLGLLTHALRPDSRLLALVEHELAAQVDLFVQYGFVPQHLTTHMQFHLSPPLGRIVLALAERYQVAWVRPHRLRATVLPFNPLLDPYLGATSGGTSPVFLAVLQPWRRFAPQRLARRLQLLKGPIELVVHPCRLPDSSFPAGMRYGARERAAEQQYLERLWPLIDTA